MRTGDAIVCCKSRENSWHHQLFEKSPNTNSIKTPQRHGQIYQLNNVIIIINIIIVRMPLKAAPSALTSQSSRTSGRTPKPRVQFEEV